jgi:hypothetical protein
MRQRIVGSVVLSACLSLVVGCGPQKYTVNLNPNAFSGMYVTSNAVSEMQPPVAFSRGDYVDSRPNKEAFGVSKHYIILTDNEFRDAFYDGLKKFLESSKQSWADSGPGDVKMNVELLQTQSELLTGFWVLRFVSKLSTRITFVDAKTNREIYTATYDGYSDIVSPVGHVSMFKMVVNKSIVDCINKIGQDKQLHDALASR